MKVILAALVAVLALTGPLMALTCPSPVDVVFIVDVSEAAVGSDFGCSGGSLCNAHKFIVKAGEELLTSGSVNLGVVHYAKTADVAFSLEKGANIEVVRDALLPASGSVTTDIADRSASITYAGIAAATSHIKPNAFGRGGAQKVAVVITNQASSAAVAQLAAGAFRSLPGQLLAIGVGADADVAAFLKVLTNGLYHSVDSYSELGDASAAATAVKDITSRICATVRWCDSKPCGAHGTCTSTEGSYSCSCDAGWTGPTCKVYNPCTASPSPCQNGGTCTGGDAGSYTCQCASGFTGKNCEEISTCDGNANVCGTHGTCVNGATGPHCECTGGYSGPTCDESPKCTSAPNVANSVGMAQCAGKPEGSKCTVTCKQGFTTTTNEVTCTSGSWTSSTCEPDPCAVGPCKNGGQCTRLTSTTYRCDCGDCFEGATCGSAATCTGTPTIANAVLSCDGQTCSVTCNAGFTSSTSSLSCKCGAWTTASCVPVIDGEWTPWSACDCPVDNSALCGQERQCTQTRTCKAPQNGGKPCEGEKTRIHSCGKHSCPVPCAWGQWSEWKEHPAACGEKPQCTRTRSIATAAYNGGAPCTGDDSATKECGTVTPCPQDGGWTDFSPCSCTPEQCAGTATCVETRTCSNPAPLNGGKDCAGSSTRTHSCTNCPTDGTWSEWTECTCPTVGCGVQPQCTQTRTCQGQSTDGKPCVGPSTRTVDCGQITCCPEPCTFGNWILSENPTPKCGEQGRCKYVRDLLHPAKCGGACNGETTKWEDCGAVTPCPENCEFTEWSAWSAPSGNCGEYPKCTRSRTVGKAAKNGGTCDGDLEETDNTCGNITPCPTDGGWTKWSDCECPAAVCDADAPKCVQTRTCSNPPPANGGAACSGPSEHEVTCGPKTLCPVDCVWSQWEVTAAGQVECGVQPVCSQSRSILTPAANGGAQCRGESNKVENCGEIEDCPVDCAWGPWVISDQNCATNKCTETRVQIPAQNGGKPCEGADTREKACGPEVCPDVPAPCNEFASGNGGCLGGASKNADGLCTCGGGAGSEATCVDPNFRCCPNGFLNVVDLRRCVQKNSGKERGYVKCSPGTSKCATTSAGIITDDIDCQGPQDDTPFCEAVTVADPEPHTVEIAGNSVGDAQTALAGLDDNLSPQNFDVQNAVGPCCPNGFIRVPLGSAAAATIGDYGCYQKVTKGKNTRYTKHPGYVPCTPGTWKCAAGTIGDIDTAGDDCNVPEGTVPTSRQASSAPLYGVVTLTFLYVNCSHADAVRHQDRLKDAMHGMLPAGADPALLAAFRPAMMHQQYQPEDDSSHGKGGHKVALIVGVVMGAAIVVLLLALLGTVCCLMQSNKRRAPANFHVSKMFEQPQELTDSPRHSGSVPAV